MRRVLILLGLVLIVAAAVYLWPQVKASEDRLHAIEAEQRGVSRDIQRLRRATSGGKSRKRVEALARDRLGMVERGEKAFVVTGEEDEAKVDEVLISEATSDAATQDAEGDGGATSSTGVVAESSADVAGYDEPAAATPDQPSQPGLVARVMAFFGLLPTPEGADTAAP